MLKIIFPVSALQKLNKMKRWSSLQKQLYKITDKNINFQIHLSKYRMNSQYGSVDLPRYWITLDNEIIFDYPKNFTDNNVCGNFVRNLNGDKSYYPYQTEISGISALIREYIDTPKEKIFSKHFDNDFWGLTNILKAADRRFGKRRLMLLRKRTNNKMAQKIIQYRLNYNFCK